MKRCSSRSQYISALSDVLDGRKLIWFGARACDAQSLCVFENFKTSFSVISPFDSFGIKDYCLETLSSYRVNLDIHDIDKDLSPEAKQLRKFLCDELDQQSVIIPYRPLELIDSVFFPRNNYVEYLGQFRELQAPFEHKIWVETELRKSGIMTIPWRYLTVHANSLRTLKDAVNLGPCVIRLNRSCSGAGLRILTCEEDLIAIWPWLEAQAEGYFSVAEYLYPSTPLSISACVFPDGEVVVHPFSIQIIGDPTLTPYQLGFCGNDFGSVKELPEKLVEEFDLMVRRVGEWLAGKGFLGAFGIDALIFEERLYLTEVNPRFLGSSRLAADLDKFFDYPDVFMVHMGAHLGLSPPKSRSLPKIYKDQPSLSQAIYHNLDKVPVSIKYDHNKIFNCEFRAFVLPKPSIALEHGSTICRVVASLDLANEYGKIKKDFVGKLNSALMTLGIEAQKGD